MPDNERGPAAPGTWRELAERQRAQREAQQARQVGRAGVRSRPVSGAPPGRPGRVGSRRRMRMVPFDHPSRAMSKPVGWTSTGRRVLVALRVTDGRMHVHLLGPTGVGKSTLEQHMVFAEVYAGRGVVLVDPMGDLADGTLARLPDTCGNRLVIIDPAETIAPPAWNPLQVPPGGSPELAAENIVGVFARLYASFWGPRMEDTLRAACLTLAHRPGSTLAQVIPLLTNSEFRRRALSEIAAVPGGLEGFWEEWETQTPAQRTQACGPLLTRLRAVFTRKLARDLLAAPNSTFDLGDILDGGVLIARLPKGLLGEDCCRLVGSLLLAGLWQATTARAGRAADERPDATIIVDECHNFLNLPIGISDALAESRGYRVSWVLAHQHLRQLPPEVRAAVDANARNKIYFTLSAEDAARLARHVEPYLDARDLSARPAFALTCRLMAHGEAVRPVTLDAPEPMDPVPGRAEWLRAQARAHTGLPAAERDQRGAVDEMAARPDANQLQPPAPAPGAGAVTDGERRSAADTTMVTTTAAALDPEVDPFAPHQPDYRPDTWAGDGTQHGADSGAGFGAGAGGGVGELEDPDDDQWIDLQTGERVDRWGVRWGDRREGRWGDRLEGTPQRPPWDEGYPLGEPGDGRGR